MKSRAVGTLCGDMIRLSCQVSEVSAFRLERCFESLLLAL